MSKLYYIDDKILEDMKNKIESNLELYKQEESWCEELLDVEISELEKPVELVHYEDNRTQADLENSIALFEALKELPYSIASNEKYWAFLTHTVYWDYMRKRWPVEEYTKDQSEFIKGRYFFSPKFKNFYRNGLSRLWWYASLTYDEVNIEDPYYYTKLMLSRQDVASLIMDSPRVSRNKIATQAFLSCVHRLLSLEHEGEIEKVKDKEKFIRAIMKKVNYLGAVTIWDALEKEEAISLLWKSIEKDIHYSLKEFV